MGRAEKTRSGARGDFFGSAAFFSCFRASSLCPSRSVTWRPNRAFIFGGLMKSPPVGCRRCGRRAGASGSGRLRGGAVAARISEPAASPAANEPSSCRIICRVKANNSPAWRRRSICAKGPTHGSSVASRTIPVRGSLIEVGWAARLKCGRQPAEHMASPAVLGAALQRIQPSRCLRALSCPASAFRSR